MVLLLQKKKSSRLWRLTDNLSRRYEFKEVVVILYSIIISVIGLGTNSFLTAFLLSH